MNQKSALLIAANDRILKSLEAISHMNKYIEVKVRDSNIYVNLNKVQYTYDLENGAFTSALSDTLIKFILEKEAKFTLSGQGSARRGNQSWYFKHNGINSTANSMMGHGEKGTDYEALISFYEYMSFFLADKPSYRDVVLFSERQNCGICYNETTMLYYHWLSAMTEFKRQGQLPEGYTIVDKNGLKPWTNVDEIDWYGITGDEMPSRTKYMSAEEFFEVEEIEKTIPFAEIEIMCKRVGRIYRIDPSKPNSYSSIMARALLKVFKETNKVPLGYHIKIGKMTYDAERFLTRYVDWKGI